MDWKTIFVLYVMTMIAINIVGRVLLIGHERKPITNGQAAFGVIHGILYLIAFYYWFL